MTEFLQLDHPVECSVTRDAGGSFDPVTGQWSEGPEVVTSFVAEIQPKSGSRRAQEAGTKYASSHWLQCGPGTDIRPGDTVAAEGRNFTVIHVADWTTHIEADIEALR